MQIHTLFVCHLMTSLWMTSSVTPSHSSRQKLDSRRTLDWNARETESGQRVASVSIGSQSGERDKRSSTEEEYIRYPVNAPVTSQASPRAGLEFELSGYSNDGFISKGTMVREAMSSNNENRSDKAKKKVTTKKKGQKRKSLKSSCNHFRGNQRKECRRNKRLQKIISKRSVTMQGAEACQYYNMIKCTTEGRIPIGNVDLSWKCGYRENFLKCMETRRRHHCDPNFNITGNVQALRKEIRDVISSTDSCLVMQAVEG